MIVEAPIITDDRVDGRPVLAIGREPTPTGGTIWWEVATELGYPYVDPIQSMAL